MPAVARAGGHRRLAGAGRARRHARSGGADERRAGGARAAAGVDELAARLASEARRDHPRLREVSRLTLRDSLRGFRLALWDERRRRLVSFRALRASAAA